MLEIVKADYLDEYKIFVEFNNGNSGVVDLSPILWGDMFEPLKDINNFKDFSVSEIFGTIQWKNGVDIAPEYLLNNIG